MTRGRSHLYNRAHGTPEPAETPAKSGDQDSNKAPLRGLLRLGCAVYTIGLLILISSYVVGCFVAPREFYPVMTLHADITVTPSTVTVRDQPKGLPDPDGRALDDTSQIDCHAFVRLHRTVPLRRGRKGTYSSYSFNGHQPQWEELQQAGPECGVEVHIGYLHFESGRYTSFVYPYSPDRADASDKPMDEQLVQRILPAFADWVFEMSGDQGFADGVRAGGTPIPPLPGRAFSFFLQWAPLIGCVLVLIGLGPATIVRYRAAKVESR